MKPFDLTKNNLLIDVDCPYDKEQNKIDVYSNCYWSAESKKEYDEKEALINNYLAENDLFKLYAWCDISGYEYWGVQHEENYVSIDVVLKKQPNEYSQKEINVIREAIVSADDFFVNTL